jgi:lipoprotein-anchoring transpeptidase ErfK/SrfK
MRRFICILFALTLWLIPLARAEVQTPAEVRANDEARLSELGFLSEPGTDEAYDQAVKEFQRYLNRLADGTAKAPDPSEGAAGSRSIKPLTTYSDIDSIQAFKAYAVVDNEGDLGEESAPDAALESAQEPEDEGAPYPVTGALDEAGRARLNDPALPVYLQDLKQGDDGSEVRRVQRRLITLKFADHAADGIFDAKTASALQLFQEASDLPATGAADRATQEAMFSPKAVASDLPLYAYQIKIDTERQIVTAYAWVDGAYTKVARKMVCSTGLDDTPTPAGTYKATGPVARWCYFPSYGCWAQYAFRIKGGVLFHSVLYEQAKESTLIKGSVKKLGQKSSHGCVRLSVADAKWIFEHCTAGTTIIVE